MTSLARVTRLLSYERQHHGRPGVVGVVLEAGVDDAVVRGDEGVLVAAVEVHAVCVEEEAVPGHGSVIRAPSRA